ncbi:LysE family translocator [Microvirga sp. VF16]|uniref:LysE family translocator n=1 Tax=Microvirga sp. VF16 TaxID=2807101 RepID=UPI00193E7168|nr:LysE family translocator [Microvirga sp. VF16]QRM32165.1 LysE family translocator [Microvirga sp. VF16]QRM32933.1 LysE family translocator [Microvirga sp. VF16]
MTTDLHQIGLVYTAYVIAAASPGPSNMAIMSMAMRQGRTAALVLAAGVVTGSLFWGVLAATGISALLARYAHVLVILKVLGGVYLLYLAVRAARSALTPDGTGSPSADHEKELRSALLYRRGLLLHLTNPKSVLAWIALMTLGLGPGATGPTVALILSGCATLSVTIFCGYAVMFSTRPMVKLYGRARRWIEGTLAAFFGIAGLRLLLSRS